MVIGTNCIGLRNATVNAPAHLPGKGLVEA